jgi:hypothetical protein
MPVLAAPSVCLFRSKLRPNSFDAIGFGRVQIMTFSVAAIKGTGIAAFYAESGAAAMVRVGDRLFRDDLMVLTTDGLPLWDGMADVPVRPAFWVVYVPTVCRQTQSQRNCGLL